MDRLVRSPFGGLQVGSLQALCIKTCANATIERTLLLLDNPKGDGKVTLSYPYIQPALPSKIFEEIFREIVQDLRLDSPGKFHRVLLALLKENSVHMPIRSLNLMNCVHLDDKILKMILKKSPNVKEINIKGCKGLTPACLSRINQSSKLESLIIGSVQNSSLQLPLKLKGPALKKVVICDWKPKHWMKRIYPKIHGNYLNELLKHVINDLTYLDLSGCAGMRDFNILSQALELNTLILNDSMINSGVLDHICELKKLRVLNISVSQLGNLVEGTLERLLTSLPNLRHLDISGRKLNGESVKELPLNCLEYLGLYATSSIPSGNHLLKIQYSGNANEGQRINALKQNIYRPRMLLPILKDLLKVDNLEIEEWWTRLDLIIQLMQNRSFVGIVQNVVLMCLLQILQVPQIILDKEMKGEMYRSLCLIIKDNHTRAGVMTKACDILYKIGNPDDSALDFIQFSEMMMSLETAPVDLNTFSIVCRFRKFLTSTKNPTYMEHLVKLNIVEKSVAFLTQLHWNFRSQVILGEHFLEPVFILWETLGNVTKNCFEGRKRFVETEGLKWTLWLLRWYPQLEDLQNQRIQRARRVITDAMEICHSVFEPIDSVDCPRGKKRIKELHKERKYLAELTKVSRFAECIRSAKMLEVSDNNNADNPGDDKVAANSVSDRKNAGRVGHSGVFHVASVNGFVTAPPFNRS